MGRVWEASDYYERILQIHESFQEWKPGWLLGASFNLLLRLTLTPSKTFWDLTLRAFPPLDTMSSYMCFVPSVDDFFQCLWAYELPPLWFARVMVPQHILLILITAYGAQFELRKKNTLWKSKRDHMRVLLCRFDWNGHTLRLITYVSRR